VLEKRFVGDEIMKRFQKVLRVLAMGVMVGTVAAQAEAATISISPVSQDVMIGDPVFADVIVGDLAADESVGGVSFELSFNDSILSGVGFTVDPDDLMGAEFDLSFGFAGGAGSPLDIFFLADENLDHAALKALQGNGFRVARIEFTAIANGLSGLNLGASPSTGIFLSDAEGNELPTNSRNGSVCVGGNCRAPEPGLLALFGTAIGAMTVRRRRARA
jgi:hypothetical protein